ncbi:hypothetical protein Leryth_017463 [Lithospermum erythrorhizon]|nr:hypothetical protein Leryth_017463 [Lithospermum erythrorhizon]
MTSVTQQRDDLRDVEIWGVPLLPSKGHECTDIVLMKFLKAKNYRVSKAFCLLQKTMTWRRDLKIDEEFDNGLEKMWEMQGRDYVGRPVCYYRPGVFENRELMKKYLETKDRCSNYMRWRVQCVERAVREIVFREGGANSIVQIIDLKNAHSNAMEELHHSTNRNIMSLIHEIYPGILVINVPLWYMAVRTMKMNLITNKRKKYIFVRSLKVTETLLKLLPPEIIPTRYGGLKRENDDEFSTDDKVIEAIVRANWTRHIRIPVDQAGVTVTWDLTVVGFNVTYKEQFIPNDDCSYKVLIQKERKMQGTVRNSFHIREAGNILITISNGTFKKRRIFYRHRSKPTIPYVLAE